ncbi:MAG: hypothetical protein EBR71_06405 [Planctomycetes bacterium]|nr:hypothetical protein [Planctomycetota bacterium]
MQTRFVGLIHPQDGGQRAVERDALDHIDVDAGMRDGIERGHQAAHLGWIMHQKRSALVGIQIGISAEAAELVRALRNAVEAHGVAALHGAPHAKHIHIGGTQAGSKGGERAWSVRQSDHEVRHLFPLHAAMLPRRHGMVPCIRLGACARCNE